MRLLPSNVMRTLPYTTCPVTAGVTTTNLSQSNSSAYIKLHHTFHGIISINLLMTSTIIKILYDSSPNGEFKGNDLCVFPCQVHRRGLLCSDLLVPRGSITGGAGENSPVFGGSNLKILLEKPVDFPRHIPSGYVKISIENHHL